MLRGEWKSSIGKHPLTDVQIKDIPDSYENLQFLRGKLAKSRNMPLPMQLGLKHAIKNMRTRLETNKEFFIPTPEDHVRIAWKAHIYGHTP